jgi:hypothetical protein
MSKKKNTLKDLDDFLKQQAATLVTPARLSVQTETPPPPATEDTKDVAEIKETVTSPEVTTDKLFQDLQALAKKEGHHFRNQFYDLIIKSVEAQNLYSPEDKMLINTALYLRSGDRWKDTIREYWRKKR